MVLTQQMAVHENDSIELSERTPYVRCTLHDKVESGRGWRGRMVYLVIGPRGAIYRINADVSGC